ncbi:lipase [Pseudomonas syringae]|uniref:Lipase n=1 Tax=Pseudomonas syringae TaxID=317 RepID=A0A1C7YWC6_PSESX|nr:alpha/beta hydrolase [Pseudomonas syringae]OCR21971.1 lipase [Pseudomonas syringae]
MAGFVARTQSFSSSAPDMRKQRIAYSTMCRAFTPARRAGLAVTDFELADVAVRSYRPDSLSPDAAADCVLYLHGGGWVVGDLDSHDFICTDLALDLGCVVIAVDYRLAPEHPFPAAFEDCVAVWHGIQAQAEWLRINPLKVAVAGDSAGATLAAALCLALRDAGQPQPRAQVLIYPALGGAADLPSRSECADAPLLSSVDIDCYQALYAAKPEHMQSPYAWPLLAQDFSQLAPAFVAVAQFDPLRDDGTVYEQKLREAGVATSFYPGKGLVHGCLRAKGQAQEADELYRRVVEALRIIAKNT